MRLAAGKLDPCKLCKICTGKGSLLMMLLMLVLFPLLLLFLLFPVPPLAVECIVPNSHHHTTSLHRKPASTDYYCLALRQPAACASCSEQNQRSP